MRDRTDPDSGASKAHQQEDGSPSEMSQDGAAVTDADATHDERHGPRIISTEEQKKAFRRAQRHSRRVFVLKWSLPIIALAIIGGFVGWVSKNKPADTTAEIQLEDDSLKQDELVMQNPNLNGYTDGRAYEVAADKASQKVETPNVINLDNVKARITDDKQEWVTIDANTGVFDQQAETLGLDGEVKVDSSLGYKLNTEKVAVDMPKGYMETLSPVNIASRDIRLSANRLEAIDNGEQFRFSGNVRLFIDAALLNKSSAQSQDNQESAPRQEDEIQ